MKQTKLLSAVFAAVGVVIAMAGVALCLSCRDAAPVLAAVPQDAKQCADDLMNALSRGDYESAGDLLYGTPDLGVGREAADEVGVLIWDAFEDSIEYEFTGDFYATDTGIARDVTITTLDITSVTQTLRERSQTLLERRVQNAENVSQVYDENNDYREDFVMDVLFDAAYQSLQEDARNVTRDVTLKLVYRQGSWWVLPDPTLLAAISGGTAG